ncbi:MAG TPA: cupin, partial [Streptomyces sp.]|nr:cupin [Streptomyces sp.]
MAPPRSSRPGNSPGSDPGSQRDGFHPDLPDRDGAGSTLPLRARLHHIRSDALDGDTAQSGGMRRFAAISGQSVG